MEARDYETLVNSALLTYPEDKGLLVSVMDEITPERFLSADQKLIYIGISNLMLEGRPITVSGLIDSMGKDRITEIGGEEVIRTTARFVDLAGTDSDFNVWVKRVSTNGKISNVLDVLKTQVRRWEQLEVTTKLDVDTLLSDLVTDFSDIAQARKGRYKPISVGVEAARAKLSRIKEGKLDLLDTGLPSMRNYLIPRPLTTGVIAGMSTMGKTQFLIMLELCMAATLKAKGIPGYVNLVTLETPDFRIVDRMACSLIALNSKTLDLGMMDEQQEADYAAALNFIEELPLIVCDNTNVTSSEMLLDARVLSLTNGQRWLSGSDYLELFGDRGDSEERRLDGVITNHRTVTRLTGSCEIIVAQYNNSVADSQSKLGSIHKTRHTGQLGQECDWFIDVWNPVEMLEKGIGFTPPGRYKQHLHQVVMRLLKNKEYDVGDIYFDWIAECKRIVDPALGYFVPQLVSAEFS